LTGHYDVLRNDLLKTGKPSLKCRNPSSPITSIWAINNGYDWRGKDPAIQGNFAAVSVTHDFGKTIGWEFKEGRDFSREFAMDSSGIILNETAVKFMGFKKPIGEIVKINEKAFHVIGVVKDLVMQSPYSPVFRTSFVLDYNDVAVINLKINPAISSREALAKLEVVFKNTILQLRLNTNFRMKNTPKSLATKSASVSCHTSSPFSLFSFRALGCSGWPLL
jgi:hypothetical protein